MLFLNPNPIQAYPSGLTCLLDYPVAGVNVVKAVTTMNGSPTASGTGGTNALIASTTVTNTIQAGEKLRIGGTDVYTVATSSGTAITTVETLSTTYTNAALALDATSKWLDTSGNQNHWTQTALVNKPKFNPAQLNTTLNVLTFDGLNQLLGPGALYGLPNADSTTFAIAKRNTETGSSQVIMGMVNNGVDTEYRNQFQSTSGGVSVLNGASASVATNTGNTNTNYSIMCFRRSGATQGVSVNNNAEITNALAVNGANVNLATLGASAGTFNLIGSIAKYVTFNRSLQASEIVGMFRKLSAETAIAIS